MDAAAFVERTTKPKRQAYYVVTGEEDFLKRRAIAKIHTVVFGGSIPEFAVSSYAGNEVEFSDVRNELDTLPFLSEARLVIIEQADPFVSKYRPQLEKYFAKPSTMGVLVLEVKTWASTTNLAKATPDECLITAKAPAAYRLPAWCVSWANTRYQKKLHTATAEFLVEVVGPEMGLLDSELNKLATFVGEKAEITHHDVDLLVARNRSSNVFRILDAIAEGKSSEAFTILNELLEANEEPIGILGALSVQLRRVASTARLHQQGVPLDDAMDQAGVAKWPVAREGVRKQMRHLGWNRMGKLLDWLVEADMGLKGGSPLPVQTVLERLIVLLARPRTATAKEG